MSIAYKHTDLSKLPIIITHDPGLLSVVLLFLFTVVLGIFFAFPFGGIVYFLSTGENPFTSDPFGAPLYIAIGLGVAIVVLLTCAVRSWMNRLKVKKTYTIQTDTVRCSIGRQELWCESTVNYRGVLRSEEIRGSAKVAIGPIQILALLHENDNRCITIFETMVSKSKGMDLQQYVYESWQSVADQLSLPTLEIVDGEEVCNGVVNGNVGIFQKNPAVQIGSGSDPVEQPPSGITWNKSNGRSEATSRITWFPLFSGMGMQIPIAAMAHEGLNFGDNSIVLVTAIAGICCLLFALSPFVITKRLTVMGQCIRAESRLFGLPVSGREIPLAKLDQIHASEGIYASNVVIVGSDCAIRVGWLAKNTARWLVAFAKAEVNPEFKKGS